MTSRTSTTLRRPAVRAPSDDLRRRVHDTLTRSASVRSLPPAERNRLAESLVRVLGYLSDPAAGQQGMRAPAARPLATPRDNRAPVGGEIKAGAVEAGTKAFKELVDTVDFPDFVSGLIDGVFNSIVDASIKQMDAYGKLLESVVKSVNEFATDNFTLNQGRDYLVNRFPSALELDTSGEQPKVRMKSGVDEESLPDFKQALGYEGDVDFSDEQTERGLAEAAQLQMARLRQKQLATMVLLGINRIVVTDGRINAKVVFDVSATDKATRGDVATQYDSDTEWKHKRSGNIWGTNRESSMNTKVSTATSFQKDDSESRVDAKAKLTGEVTVNFKSETFPLERLADSQEINAVNERSGAGAQ